MTEADMDNTADTAMRQALVTQLAAQGDGPPIWRDLHAFGADVMLGFDGRGRVLLRMRPRGAAEATVIALAPDDAQNIAEALHAASVVADEALAAEAPQG